MKKLIQNQIFRPNSMNLPTKHHIEINGVTLTCHFDSEVWFESATLKQVVSDSLRVNLF